MAESNKCKVHSADFKAKVALEAVRGVMTINEVVQKFGVHPMMVRQWKKECLDNAGSVFSTKRGPKPVDHAKEDALHGEIGRLKMKFDWLKKKSGL